MSPPFFIDNNSLDFLEHQLAGRAGNKVRVLLLEAIEKKMAVCPYPILEEYKEKSDPPIFVEDEELKPVFDNAKRIEAISELPGISSNYPKTLKRIKRTNKDPGDPWLLANAKAFKGTIVTEEAPSPAGIGKKQGTSLHKLPDICCHAGISCTTGQGFLNWCEENLL